MNGTRNYSMKFRTKVKEIDAIQYDGTNAVAVLKHLDPNIDITKGPGYDPEKFTETTFAEHIFKYSWAIHPGLWLWTSGGPVLSADTATIESEYEPIM
jgi:hypothetical protein